MSHTGIRKKSWIPYRVLTKFCVITDNFSAPWKSLVRIWSCIWPCQTNINIQIGILASLVLSMKWVFFIFKCRNGPCIWFYLWWNQGVQCWESTTLYILYHEIASWLKVQSRLYFILFSHPWWKSTIIDNFNIISRLTPKIFLTITNVCIPVGLNHKC